MKQAKPIRTPLWEKTKQEKRKTRLIRLVILAIFAIIIVNLAIKLPGIYRDLNNPFPRFPGETQKTSDLDFSFRTNVLLVSYEKNRLVDLGIATYEPVDKKTTVILIDLPSNKPIRLTTNKIFRSGGIDYLSAYISNSTGVILDRYIAISDPSVYFTPENVQKIHSDLNNFLAVFQFFTFKAHLNKVLKTDLTTPKLINLAMKFRNSRFEKKDAISLEDQGIQDLANNLFLDRKIVEEGAAVTIRNSSEQPMIGRVLENYLNNLGVTVVSVESGDASEKSILIVKNKKPQIEKRLESIIKVQKRGLGKDDAFSGDLLIIIGKEAASKLTLP